MVNKNQHHWLASRKLLMIAYKFPPIKSIGSTRNFKIYKQFQSKAASIKVLTTTNQSFLLKDEMDVDDSQVHPLSTFDYRSFTNLLKKSNSNVYGISKSKGPGRWMSQLLNSFPFNITIGEGGLLYIIAGFLQGRRMIQSGKVDTIYSSFRPYADHVIAMLLKRSYPEVYWISDFRDLHIDPIKDNLWFRSFQKFCNKKILSKADLITTVSNGLANQLQKENDNVVVLRNAIDKNDLKEQSRSKYDNFTIAYTGSILPSHQKATYFFKALKAWIENEKIAPSQLQIIYAGNTGGIFDDWIKEHELDRFYTNKGFLPLKDALSIQQSAHINLLLSWCWPEMGGTLCGKLNEYLAAQNPILCLIDGVYDEEFESIFKQLNAGLVAYNKQEEVDLITSFLQKHYKDWKVNGKLTHKFKTEQLKYFTWDHNMEILEEAIAPKIKTP